MGRAPKTPSERFWSKVDKTPDCWVWTASVVSGPRGGYGQFRSGGAGSKMKRAHVWAYEEARGPVPEGLELDHLCRNRLCVRPDHLEAVTRAENRRRSPLTPEARMTCPQGHDTSNAPTDSNGWRRWCAECAATARATPAAKERMAAAGRRHEERHGETAYQKRLAWRRANPEKIAEYNRRYAARRRGVNTE